jgi:hypothetical protein
MVSISDFKTPDGVTNWDAYNKAAIAERQAQIQAGERCYECKGHIPLYDRGNGPTRCGDCRRAAETDGEIAHSKLRCPFCRAMLDPCEHAVWDEGDHEIFCGDCEKNFRIRTEVSVTFYSPPLGRGGFEDDEDDI